MVQERQGYGGTIICMVQERQGYKGAIDAWYNRDNDMTMIWRFNSLHGTRETRIWRFNSLHGTRETRIRGYNANGLH